MKLRYVSLDLHAEMPEDNIMTEYEEKFSAKGHPIYRLESKFDNLIYLLGDGRKIIMDTYKFHNMEFTWLNGGVNFLDGGRCLELFQKHFGQESIK